MDSASWEDHTKKQVGWHLPDMTHGTQKDLLSLPEAMKQATEMDSPSSTGHAAKKTGMVVPTSPVGTNKENEIDSLPSPGNTTMELALDLASSNGKTNLISPTSRGYMVRSGSGSLKIGMRSSVMDSIRACGLAGIKIEKEVLKQKIVMPQYLRYAMRDSIRFKDPNAGESRYIGRAPEENNAEAPESPMVVFINPRSGGRHGPVLKERLQQLLSEEQVFDLSDVKPPDFVIYGLGCLELLADLGDTCAKETRERMKVMVAGGDGTVGWVLGCVGDLHSLNRGPVPPVGIIPLGTGNDLSRSFGWGGSFPYSWKSAVKRSLYRAATGPVGTLDSWQALVSMPAGTAIEPPHSLKQSDDRIDHEGMEYMGELPEKVKTYKGVFYNYFSIGMDAQVAYGFHHLRNEKPFLTQGPISNKIVYSGYSCSQGWFFTSCSSDPGLRGIRNILRMHVKKANCSEWELVVIPKSVRSLVMMNLNSYASGRNPWGNLKPEYMEKKGFVEAQANDGLLEIFGLKQGWHASFVMGEMITAKHIAQAAEIRFELRGGDWKKGYLQMDGEPWKQRMNKDTSTFIEIKRVPHQSLMIHGE